MSSNDISATGTASDVAGDDIVELDDAFFSNAQVRRGGKVVRAATGTIANRGRPRKPESERKQAVSIRLSPKVLAHFRAEGEGWQTRIDEVLLGHVQSSTGTEPADAGTQRRAQRKA